MRYLTGIVLFLAIIGCQGRNESASALNFQSSGTALAQPATKSPAKPVVPQYKTITLYNWDLSTLRAAARNDRLRGYLSNDVRQLTTVLNTESAAGWTFVAAIPLTRDLSVLNDQNTSDVRSNMEQVRLVFRKP